MVIILVLFLALPMALACTIPSDDLLINADTVLCNGTYSFADAGSPGLIIINADDIALTCNGTILNGSQTFGERGIDIGAYNNVTIQGCAIQNYESSTYFNASTNIIFYNNTLNASVSGVHGFRATNVTVTQNNFYSNMSNSSYGLNIINSENMLVSNNTFDAVRFGMDIRNSNNTDLVWNTGTAESFFIYLNTIQYGNISQNVGTAGDNVIYFLNSLHLNISDNTANVSDYGTGIYLFNTSQSIMHDNNITSSMNDSLSAYSGLVLTVESNYNYVYDNYLTGNDAQFWLTERASNNIIEHNTIYRGKQFILSGNASNNILRHNIISESWARNYGVSTLYTTNNTFLNNTARNCGPGGSALLSNEGAQGNYFYTFTADNCTNGIYFRDGTANNIVINATLTNMTRTIFLEDVRNITLENINGETAITGIYLDNATEITFTNTPINNATTGIEMRDSYEITFTDLLITNVVTGAIVLAANNITFDNINITGASGPDTGIHVNDTRNLTITNSNISSNTGSGLHARNSTFHVSGSTINSNTGFGIVNYDLPILETASTILNNTICYNTLLPIFSLDAAITTISGNEFCGAAIAYEQNWSVQIRARRDGIMQNETNITIWQPYTNSTSYNISITNNSGLTPTIIITEYILDATETRTNLTPHRLLAEKSGSAAEINMTINETRTTAVGGAINITLPGVVPPYFTGIPDNDTATYGEDWPGVDFNATDSGTFDSYAVNDTRFTINTTGYLDNTTPLAAAEYSLNISINDTEGYVNFTLYNLTVTRASSNVSTYLNNSRANTTIEQGASIWTNGTRNTGEGSISLYNNGTLINTGTSIGNLTIFTSIGLYNITTIYAQTENYTTSSETYWVNVTTDTNAPTITLIAPSNGASSATSAYNFTFSISDTNNITNCSLIIDNSVSDTLNNPDKTLAGIYASGLSIASHTWRITCTDYYNNTANSSTYTIVVTSEVSSGGGGGGGGGGWTPIDPEENETDPNETMSAGKQNETEEDAGDKENDDDLENLMINPQSGDNDRNNKFVDGDGGNGEPYDEQPRLKPVWEIDWKLLWFLPALALPFILFFARRKDPYRLLKRYIEAHVFYGTKPAVIKTELLNVGWDEDAIRKYLFLATADDKLYPLRQYIHDHKNDEALIKKLRRARWGIDAIEKAQEQRARGHELAQMLR